MADEVTNLDLWASTRAALETASALGRLEQADGTALIGRVPHVAPNAWLHVVFRPLSADEIAELERLVERRLPAPVQALLSLANGVHVFSGALSIDGLRRDHARTPGGDRLPFSMRTPNVDERPQGASIDDCFVGGYKQDGSKIAVRPDGSCYRCARWEARPATEWPSLFVMLSEEVRRLATLFDQAGQARDPAVDRVPSPGPLPGGSVRGQAGLVRKPSPST